MSGYSFLILIIFTTLQIGCERRPDVHTPGAKLIEKYQCYRCHNSKKWMASTVESGCVSCHTEILNGKQDNDYPKEKLNGWKANIVSFPTSPNLDGARRFNQTWLQHFLRHPVDLRPSLAGMMPRLAITDEEAKILASYLTKEKASNLPMTTLPSSGDFEKGEGLFKAKFCGSCHAFGGNPPPLPTRDRGKIEAVILAPDLGFTRQRMSRQMTFEWLKDPRSFDPSTKMPTFDLSDQERVDIIHYIFEKKIGEEKAITPFRRLPLLKRDVFYPEVKRAIFRHSCWHCHSTPRRFSGIDGGPGNAGGFGYAGKGIDLSSLHAIKEANVFAEIDGMPKLVRHLVARHEEIEGRRTSYLGMPLGLEPCSAEKIQLVETWIKQGARDAPP